jgi:DNA helicase-2/ATP-dependent DNA helicase PcrA
MSAFELTLEQRDIISAPNAHYVVRAVAGSGKTTTLAYRIQNLLHTGLDPRRVLVLMFNKSAQIDFTNKLQAILGPSERAPEVRTFHAMGYRLYKRFIQEGVLPPFQERILSEREMQFQLLQMAPRFLDAEQAKEFKRNKKEHLDIAAAFIDQCKSQMEDAHTFFKHADYEAKFSYLPQVFQAFEDWRKERKRISYSDMLYDPVVALSQNPHLVDLVTNKMDAILVDEYQDTNDIQHELLKYVAGRRAKVTIVGDPDQTIYEFRGAKPQYMLSGFAEEFKGSETRHLSTTFRYGHQVSLLANHLISNSPYAGKHLCLPHEGNPKTDVQQIQTQQETLALLKELKHSNAKQLSNSAILLRVWSQSVAIELALLKAGVGYHLSGHQGVFGSEEMKAIQGLLCVANGNLQTMDANERLQTLLLLCRFPSVGIAEQQLQQILIPVAERATKWGYGLLHAIPDGLNRIQSLKLERMARALSELENSRFQVSTLLANYINETKLYEETRTMGLSRDSSEERIQVLKSLIDFVSNTSKTCHEALSELASLEQKTQERHAHHITITSIHRAKGLEWEHVFLPGLNEENYPNKTRGRHETKEEIASERRLLYVAITRAKHRLTLFTPPHGSPETSRFNAEMRIQESLKIANAIEKESETCTLFGLPSKVSKAYAIRYECEIESSQLGGTSNPSDDTAVCLWHGEHVRHHSFGEGKVTSEDSTTFTVEFSDSSKRTFTKASAEHQFSAATTQA